MKKLPLGTKVTVNKQAIIDNGAEYTLWQIGNMKACNPITYKNENKFIVIDNTELVGNLKYQEYGHIIKNIETNETYMLSDTKPYLFIEEELEEITILRDYLENKNKITQKFLDIVLVPEGQLENTKFTTAETEKLISKFQGWQSVVYDSSGTSVFSSLICPYCQKYRNCENCPMDKANNNCDTDDDATWRLIIHKYNELSTYNKEMLLTQLYILVDKTITKLNTENENVPSI